MSQSLKFFLEPKYQPIRQPIIPCQFCSLGSIVAGFFKCGKWAPHVNGPLSPPREPWRGAADPRGRGGGGTDGRAHDEDTQPTGDLHQTPQVEEIPDASDMVTLYGAPELLYQSFYFDSDRLEHIHVLAIANNDNENLLSRRRTTFEALSGLWTLRRSNR